MPPKRGGSGGIPLSSIGPVPPMPYLIEQTEEECVHSAESRTDGNGRSMRVEASAATMRRFQDHGRNVTMGVGASGTSQTITKADRLGSCAASGDLAKVKKLLKGGVDPNYSNTRVGAPPICIAAEFDSKPHIEIVKELLKAKADVDGRGRENITGLMMAVQFDRRTTVKLLLAAKAEVDRRCKGWPTPPYDASAMDIAARHNRHEVLEMLLAEGAVVDQTSRHGVTPLMCAAKNASVESVKILLAHKADPWLKAEGSPGCMTDAITLAYECFEEKGEMNPTLGLLLEAVDAPKELVWHAKEGVPAKNALGNYALFPDRESADAAEKLGEQIKSDRMLEKFDKLLHEKGDEAGEGGEEAEGGEGGEGEGGSASAPVDPLLEVFSKLAT